MDLPMFLRGYFRRQIVVGKIECGAAAGFAEYQGVGHAAFFHEFLSEVDGFGVIYAFEEEGHTCGIQIAHPSIQAFGVTAHTYVEPYFRIANVLTIGLQICFDGSEIDCGDGCWRRGNGWGVGYLFRIAVLLLVVGRNGREGGSIRRRVGAVCGRWLDGIWL